MLRNDAERIEPIEAAGVDVDLVRVGARHVERMNTAYLAEAMLGDFGVEFVCRQIALALESDPGRGGGLYSRTRALSKEPVTKKMYLFIIFYLSRIDIPTAINPTVKEILEP